MKRNAIILAVFVAMLAIGFCCDPPRASAQVLGDPVSPVQFSLGAFKARTQVAVGFQREWISRRGVELTAPATSWVAVIPASYNLTPSSDIVGQFAYNMTSHATRYVLGVRFVVYGGK